MENKIPTRGDCPDFLEHTAIAENRRIDAEHDILKQRFCRTSQDQETKFEEQVLRAAGYSLLERTIEFIREHVDIEDVYSQEQIRAYAARYLRIEDVYSLDNIEDYWKAKLLASE